MKLVAMVGFILGAVLFSIQNFAPLAQAADDAAANHADFSIDNLVLPSALEAQQDAALDQAFAELPAAPEGTAPPVNAEQVVAQRLAAIQDSAQEAATLGYGAAVARGGGPPGLLGTPEEHGHAGRTHEEAGCLALFQGSIGSGFEALTQGLPEGSVPPETVARFEAMHERFEQMAERFQAMMFGGAGEAGGHLPGPEGAAGVGGVPLPGVGGAVGGPEGFVMPAVGGFQFQDLGTMFGAAALGIDPAQFAQSMSQMIETRAGAFQNYFGHGDPGEQGTLPGLEGGAFAGLAPAGNNPLAAFLPGVTGEAAAGSPPANVPPEFFAAGNVFANDIAQQIAHQITENIAQRIEEKILSTLPAEALNTLNALNQDFTAADLVFLQNNPGQNITRAFSAGVTDHFKNTNGVSVDFPGLEHVHVTYTRAANGDGLFPLDHVDANVTAIHSEDHTQTADLTGSGAEHIPNIQA